MIKKHEYKNVITNFSSEDLQKYLTEAMDTISSMLKRIQFCQEFEAGSIDDFDFFTEMEELGTPDTTMLDIAASSLIPANKVVAKYLRDTIDVKNRMFQNLAVVRKSGCFFTDEEVADIEKASKDVVTGLIYTVMFDFDLPEFMRDADDKVEDIRCDEVFYMYCKALNRNPIELVNTCFDIYSEFKLKLTWFESSPELEEPFMEMMGPYIVGLNEEKLTIGDVHAVIDGTLTPEALLEKYDVKEED